MPPPRPPARCTPPLGGDLEASIEYYSKRAPHVVAAVTAAMGLFPKAPTGMGRAPRPVDAEQARQKRQHLWRYSGGTWRCDVCHDYVRGQRIPQYRLRQPCRGSCLRDEAATFAELGHTLVKVEASVPIVACTQCGAWGSRRARKLRERCGPPTGAGAQAIQRLNRGMHPLLLKDRRGTSLPRERVRIAAAYDKQRGAWVSCEATAADIRTDDDEMRDEAGERTVTPGELPDAAPHAGWGGR